MQSQAVVEALRAAGVRTGAMLRQHHAITLNSDITTWFVTQAATKLPENPETYACLVPADAKSWPLTALLGYMLNIPTVAAEDLQTFGYHGSPVVVVGYAYDPAASLPVGDASVFRGVFLFGEAKPDDDSLQVCFTDDQLITGEASVKPTAVPVPPPKPPTKPPAVITPRAFKDEVVVRRPDDLCVSLGVCAGTIPQTLPWLTDFGHAMTSPIRNAADRKAIQRWRRLVTTELTAAKQTLTTHAMVDVVGYLNPDELHKLMQRGDVTSLWWDTGTAELDLVRDLMEAAAATDVPVSVRLDDPSASFLDREFGAVRWLASLLNDFKRLRIVLLAVSDARTVDWASSPAAADRVSIGVTPHHLYHTIDDMLGRSFNATMFSNPSLKTAASRQALQRLVLSGDSRCFYMSDSEAVAMSHKGNVPRVAAGVFTAPVGLSMVATLFAKHGGAKAVANFEQFTSHNGAVVYSLPCNEDTITLKQTTVEVPRYLSQCYCYGGGMSLEWTAPALLRYCETAGERDSHGQCNDGGEAAGPECVAGRHEVQPAAVE